MKIYRSINQFPDNINTVITIGTFDGMHKGHQYILKRLNEIALNKSLISVLLTFSPHPRHVLFPDNQDLKLLNTLDEKTDILRKSGLKSLIIHEFTKEFSRKKSVNFIRDILVNRLNMKYMLIGHDHHFGRNREGSYSELKEFSDIYSFNLEEIQAQQYNSITISSTKIRKALLDKDIDKATNFLGYSYMFSGIVIHGSKLGRKIGFPTANILLQDQNKLLPADGVYAVSINVSKENYFGMLNIGLRPTLESKGRQVEVHIFDFVKNIYNKNISVSIIRFIRDEKIFQDLESLKSQLIIDRKNCKKILLGK